MEFKVKVLKRYFDMLYSREGLFFTGFIIFLGRSMWETTMLPLSGYISQTCLLLSILFIGLRIIFFDGYSVKAYLLLIGGVAGTILIYLNSGYLNPFLWLLVLLGSKDISFEKILKIYLLITVSIMMFSMCAALLGIIENLIYETEGRGRRIAFGSVYVTDFASHIFYMILTYCYLKAEQLKTYHFVGIIAIMSIVYYFCKTRLDCASMFLTIVVFGTNQWLRQSQYDGKRLVRKWQKFWRFFGVVSMPLMTAISFAMTVFYKENNKFLNLVDKIITNRLRFGKEGLDMYPIKLLGQPVDMVGAGGTTQKITDYFFIDSSYVHVLLRYGAMFMIALLLIYVLCCYKNNNDIYFLFVIALIALNCIIAHHILDTAYNPFASAFLAYNVRRDPKCYLRKLV
ncbi:hypothetical protein [Lacrimispora sp.]|uniref:hypothetical protein n=1 Tax=Lacrimispora sp. TaxID=2719234 RepID=UPI002FDAA670